MPKRTVADPNRFRPAILELVDRESVTPIRLGLFIAGALTALYLLAEWWTGRLPVVLAPDVDPETFQDFRITFVFIAALAYVPAAQLALARSVRRRIEALRGIFRGPASDLEAAITAVGSCDRSRYTRVRNLWLVLTAAFLVGDRLLEGGPLLLFNTETVAHRVLAVAVIWISVGLGQCVSADSRRLAALLAGDLEVELPDTRPLARFAQIAGQLSLAWLGLLSIPLLFVGDLDASPGVLPVLILLGVVIVTNAGIVLARPVVAARRWIQRRKRAEVSGCDERIRALRRAWEGSSPASVQASGVSAGPPMADVIAYRGLIDGASEWPFDAPAAVRVALYAGLPLGSWIAGAIVEKVIDTLF